MSARVWMDVSKPDYLEKENVRCPRNESLWQALPDHRLCNERETSADFSPLRINPPLPAGYKYERENGMFVTDVWDDIRELTAGYFAGDEALRDVEGNRLHKQQTPIQLLLRIILSSTNPGDVVLDPFAGSGTTLVVAEQLRRKSIGMELDKVNIKIIEERLAKKREADDISGLFKDYECTPDLEAIWGRTKSRATATLKQGRLFESNQNRI